MSITRHRTIAWLAALLLLSPAAVFAQATTGSIFGTVLDAQGAPLPGATVTLSGVDAPRTYVSDAKGEFRFPGVPIGTHKVEASLTGFSTVEYPTVIVNAGRNTTIDMTLSEAVEDVITVTAESPLLDERKISAGASIANMELEKIPTARDPWSLMTMTPGVQTDRINVGGNESGQQSVYVSAGSNSDDTTWQVDGVNITDMTSISSPSYFDFDAFEEVQFVTGGSDVAIESAGVTVNIVTKRGTNEWQGTARYMLTDGDWQSDPDISSGDFGRNNNGPGGSTITQAPASYVPNSIEEVEELGASIGGPILKDRLWIWGAYGESDPIDNIVGGQHDLTILENLNGKVSAQIAASNSANLQYSENNKIKDGRGAAANRSPETTTEQSGVGGGPSDITKIEDTQIFSSSFYATGMYSFVDGGFQLLPKGGVDGNVFVLEDGVYRGSYYFLFNNRDVTQYKADGSAFFQTGSASNELKFGASTRKSEVASNFGYAGNFWVYDCGFAGCSGDELGANTRLVNIRRDANSLDESNFHAAWLQDTISLGNLTLNAGLRYESSTGEVLSAAIPGVTRGGITFMPGLNAQGFDPNIEFEMLMPRVGVTYSMGAEHKTLLRASLAQFSELYLTANHTRLGSTGANGILANCLYRDTDADFVVDDGEAASVVGCTPINFNPQNPNNTRTPNVTDPDLEPAKTMELLLSVEHSLLPEFVVSAGLLYRNITDITELRPFVRENGVVRNIQPGDYVPRTAVVNGQSLEYFVRRPGVALAGGSLLTNGDREQQALGLNVGFNKRLSNRWMARGHLQYTDWEWDIPSSYFDHVDPTNFGDGVGNTASGDRDGEVVAERSGGSGGKGGIFLNAKWSANLTGLYQVAPDRPWGFNVGGAVNAREGYPSPVFASIRGSDGTTRAVQVSSSIDDSRNDDVYTFDMRLDKEIVFGDFGVTLGLDVFNAFNDNTVLQRERSATATRFNFIAETISPRIIRAGVRLNFR